MNYNVVDVSRFLLFEATADSENGLGLPNVHDDDDDDEDNGYDEGDAESCRVGPQETSCRTIIQMSGSDLDPETMDGEEDEEEGEVNSYGKWARRENRNLVVGLSSTGKDRECIIKVRKRNGSATYHEPSRRHDVHKTFRRGDVYRVLHLY
ncbi:PREDICTED: uncharacterized protein LOC104817533 isoform X2 [Tarenaya hassleriana]|uniref:uncharacterized protein LOC104817533 isoform X2 n=1 Tax=Tarenaya hassleriana TaxID=28532 RepID=UPI0008FD43E8|nr:PREDICTED: uncharacterized protein LOC104817533 isoform X2 [Tarenaya hassleriana]